MLKWLHLKFNVPGKIDLNTWCIDSTAASPHTSAEAGKNVSDARGIPLHFTR